MVLQFFSPLKTLKLKPESARDWFKIVPDTIFPYYLIFQGCTWSSILTEHRQKFKNITHQVYKEEMLPEEITNLLFPYKSFQGSFVEHLLAGEAFTN